MSCDVCHSPSLAVCGYEAVSLCVCGRLWLCGSLSFCVCGRLWPSVAVCGRLPLSLSLCVSLCVCVRVSMSVWVWLLLSPCVCVSVCVCVCLCVGGCGCVGVSVSLSICLSDAGATYGVVSAADGSLELNIQSPCTLTLTQTKRPQREAVALGETGKRRRSVVSHTPGEEGAAAAAAPAAPRRRTRCRTAGAEDEPQEEDTPTADVVADLNEEIDGASKLAAAEAVADQEEWRWRAVPGAPSLPRWGHSVTRVGDGQLFILGGENAAECFNSGHIYQHTEGSWSFDPIPARQVRFLCPLPPLTRNLRLSTHLRVVFAPDGCHRFSFAGSFRPPRVARCRELLRLRQRGRLRHGRARRCCRVDTVAFEAAALWW